MLKKTGDIAKVVDKANIAAETIPGTIGIKVEILSPEANLADRLVVDRSKVIKIAEIKIQELQQESVHEKPEETEKKVTRRGRKPKKNGNH